MTADDAALLRRYADHRSEDAFTELVRRYIDLVYHAALRQSGGDAHRANDVTQTVFTLLARKAGSLRRHEALAGWLHTTTRLTAKRAVRTEQRRLAREHEAHLMQELTNESEAAAPWERVRPVIDDVLDELNAEDRDAVLLRFFAARPLAEIGTRLGVTENTARMRVERALEKLRARLARRGITSTSAALGLALSNQAALSAPAALAASVAGSALASATTAMPAAGLIQLMSTTKFLGGVTAFALALLIGVAVRDASVRRNEASLLATARHKSVVLSVEVRDQQASAEIAEQARAALEKSLDEARAAEAAVMATVDSPAQVHDSVAAGRQFVDAHPEAARIVTENMRARITFDYQLLFSMLALTPEQVERFQALMLEARGGVRWNTTRQAPLAEVRMGELSRDQMEAGLRALLGEAGYREYKEFDRMSGARSFVEHVAASVHTSATPLSADQAGQLVRILADSSAAYIGGRNVNLSPAEWENAIARARGILAAPQLEALTGLMRRSEFQQAMNKAVGQAMKEAREAAGIPPLF